MPQDTTLPQNTPNVPQGLDPTAYTLTRAIALQEGGGKVLDPQTPGQSGEVGIYQYEPATWNARAAQYLGPGAPSIQQATAEQQNEVTYKWVADKLSQGFSPAQVASMHNAGEGAPNAYLGNSGTNSYGVQYDTKQYVQNVQQYAEQLWNQQSSPLQNAPNQPAPAPASPPSLGGFLGNVVSSGANFLGNIGEAALHPIQTVQNLGSIPVGALQELGGQQTPETANFDAVKNYFAQRYGSVDDLLHTAYTDPVGLAADLSSVLGVGGGVVGLAGKGADLAGIGTVARAATEAEPAVEASGVAGAAQTASSALGRASELTNPLTPIVNGAGALIRPAQRGATAAIGKISGIGRDTAAQVANNDLITPDNIASMTRQDLSSQIADDFAKKTAALSQTASEYGPILNSTERISVAPDFLTNAIQNVAKVDIKDGEIFPTTVSKLSGRELGGLQDLLDTYQPAFASGSISPEEFITLRQRLDKVAYTDAGIKNTNVAKVAAQIRGQLNDAYRSQVPGLEAHDTQFATQISDIKRLSKGLFNKDGVLNENADSLVANASNPTNARRLARLEEISPGITPKIQALKAIENIRNARDIKVGAYDRSILETGGIIGSAVTGNIGLFAVAATAMLISQPDIAVKVIRTLNQIDPRIATLTMARLARYATSGAVGTRATSQDLPLSPADQQSTLPTDSLSPPDQANMPPPTEQAQQ